MATQQDNTSAPYFSQLLKYLQSNFKTKLLGNQAVFFVAKIVIFVLQGAQFAVRVRKNGANLFAVAQNNFQKNY